MPFTSAGVPPRGLPPSPASLRLSICAVLMAVPHTFRLVSDVQEIAELHAMSNGLEGPTIIGINAHSGTDMWHEDRALDFFCAVNDQVCALAQEIPRLSHETHRGRVLCCPFITSRLLARLPGLRLTSDFSHWVLKTERLLDTAAECDMLEQIAPAVVHLHARLASPQVPQIEHVHAAHTAAARERFYAFWETVWQRRLDEGDAFVTATVEYGPREWGAGGNYVGYPPFDSEKPLDVLVAEASNALRERFVAWRRCRE